jgi:arabinose-5-phosphate isomerase
MTDIQNAKAVLDLEARALQALSDSIDENLSKAVDIMHGVKTQDKNTGSGRVIIAGIGKSGHVARKIAATMASTGTPAYFVHPGEASHGDMGMITAQDVVLMLSNSGENSELSDLIHYTRRYDIPLIAMTGNADSSLATHSDVALLLPKIDEACPNGMAPTTSTTMMIALGDALAVALLKRMGLTKEQYKVFHPGGKLGQRLMTVAELMVGYDDLPLITADQTMDQAILLLSEKNLGAVLVTDDKDGLAGLITDGDLKRHMGPDLLQKPVSDVMSISPKTIRSDILAVQALDIMTKTPGQYLTSLIVMDDGALKGMIRLQDCLRAGLA